MGWNVLSPDGNQSTAANVTIMDENTVYTKTTMNIDHYWDIGANEDGHHKFAQMPGTVAGGAPSNPTIAAGMDLVYYVKQKTAADSPAQQDFHPFTIDSSSNVLQILGIRACAVFNIAAGVVTVVYNHNVASVVRTAQGRYTVTFTTALPSNAYLVDGGGIREDAANDKLMNLSVASAPALNQTKTTALVKVITSEMSGSLLDPLQVWVYCFGG